MATESPLNRAERISRVVRLVGVILPAGGLAALLAAILLPPTPRQAGATIRGSIRLPAVSTASPEVKALVARMAGLPLIRPAQVQAAVKDTGLAQRLVKQLQLQGMTVQDGRDVAYILVGKQSVVTVCEGEAVLDFLVEKIEPGCVTLSLQGVLVRLQH